MRLPWVADLVGFEDPLYFSRLYRAHFGLSPRKHRHQIESMQAGAPFTAAQRAPASFQ